jgi:hypothetical protein
LFLHLVEAGRLLEIDRFFVGKSRQRQSYGGEGNQDGAHDDLPQATFSERL